MVKDPMVTTALERLDHLTADEVATLFDATGVKGLRGFVPMCPVSAYLYQESGKSSRVALTTARIYDPDGSSEVVELPKGVCHFIARFERGDFPYLETDKHILDTIPRKV